MDDIKALIADMTNDMRFERRPPVTGQQKAAYAALEDGVGDALRDLSKLHLRLWHAASRRDYRSLSLDEALMMLGDIRSQLDMLSQKK